MKGASERAALWEYSEYAVLRAKGTTPLAAKGMDFFLSALQPHKGDATMKFEALSSVCQIVNE